MITLPLILLAIWLCATNIIPVWVCIVCCTFWVINFGINAWMYRVMLKAVTENKKN